MEHTTVLRELFDKSSPYINNCENFFSLHKLRAHPFFKAFITISTAATSALHNTQTRIKLTLRAIEECNPALSEIERALLLHEAELLSTSNTIKELRASLKEAQDQMEKKRKNKDNIWDMLLLVSKEEEEENNNNNNSNNTSSSASIKPSLQLLKHVDVALEIIEGNVGRWRLKLALCKEELALYKQEMFAFARVGILFCADPKKKEENKNSSDIVVYNKDLSSSKTPTIGNENKNIDNPSEDNNNNNNMKLHISSKQSELKLRSTPIVVSVVDRVIKEAAGANVWSIMGGRTEANTRNINTKKSNNNNNNSNSNSNIPYYNYSKEEEQQLMEANFALQEEQRTASAEDAKAVEASVRELSQLTSLMNERVVQQSEQFSILLKNTEVAQSNMHKGVGEVTKTLKCFWNSTRQLIACLWISTFILLIANWIIR